MWPDVSVISLVLVACWSGLHEDSPAYETLCVDEEEGLKVSSRGGFFFLKIFSPL
jgi:hypothetical protein